MSVHNTIISKASCQTMFTLLIFYKFGEKAKVPILVVAEKHAMLPSKVRNWLGKQTVHFITNQIKMM